MAAQVNPPQPPILISTNPHNVNPQHLTELYAACNYSCHRFPVADAAGRVDRVDPLKLSIALSHSSFVVSVFAGPELLTTQFIKSAENRSTGGIGRDWIGRMGPPTPRDGRLIGFGRAVSDLGLTASIHDVVVHPALQGRGIGRRIVERLVRMLTNRGIYDIAALCTDGERPFFRACGFGEDTLESTTMIYTRSTTTSTNSNTTETLSSGRKILLIPPPTELAI